ncbi:MAG: hypothetical protein ACLQDY_13220 [Streptosporangiaceae bacterium]
MRKYITRTHRTAAAAGIALATLGLTGAGAPATAAARSLSPPQYTIGDAGYISTGRWFRFVSATVTVPAVIPSADHICNMLITLRNTAPMRPRADILVRQGGGAGSVGWANSPVLTPFAMSPKIGDRLRVSIYYDRSGHTYFTAADITQGITRTVRVNTGTVTYNVATLIGNAGSGPVPPPPAGIRLWKVASTRLTTYTGTRGTVTGPWQTSQIIQTSTGTSSGTVMRSPSGLSDGGADFGVWLRALPLAYTQGFAGYTDSVGPFRFVATTMTVPPAQTPAANGGTAFVTLLHNGGATPRPYANIEVLPGGGAGSISYTSNAAAGTFTVNPQPGDQLAVSIFYDQNGHYSFTVTDTTQGTTQTVTVAAPYAGSMPLNFAAVAGMMDNSKVTPPPADTRIWQFTASKVTTYGGVHGSILGPWATAAWIDTTNGTPAGAVVADASVLSNAGQDFGVWLRHR